MNHQNLTQFPNQSFCKYWKTFVTSKIAANDVSFSLSGHLTGFRPQAHKVRLPLILYPDFDSEMVNKIMEHTRTWCHLSFLTPSQRARSFGNRLWPRCSHRPQPYLFQSPLLWNWDAFRMRWPINERHELTFLPVIRTLGVIASLLQRVSNYHRTSNNNQQAISPLASETSQAARKKRRGDMTVFGGSYHQRHLVHLRSPFLRAVKLRTRVNKLNLFRKETFATF